MVNCFRKSIFFYIFIAGLSLSEVSSGSASRRKKRYVVYPKGGTYKIVIGVAIPVKIGLKQSLTAALNLQAQYVTPQNSSQLHVFPPIVSRSRDKRENRIYSDRSLAYIGLEAMMDRYNMNGHMCLLRSICENSMEPLNHRSNGLYGQLLHIFLTPDYGDGELDDDLDPDYSDAQKAGRYGVDCLSLYPGCAYGQGILDLISIFDL